MLVKQDLIFLIPKTNSNLQLFIVMSFIMYQHFRQKYLFFFSNLQNQLLYNFFHLEKFYKNDHQDLSTAFFSIFKQLELFISVIENLQIETGIFALLTKRTFDSKKREDIKFYISKSSVKVRVNFYQ